MRSLDSILHQFRDTGSVTMLMAEDVEVLVRGLELAYGAVEIERHRVAVLDEENKQLKIAALEDARQIVELTQENKSLVESINNYGDWT